MKPRNCTSGCRARPGSVEPLPLLRAYQGFPERTSGSAAMPPNRMLPMNQALNSLVISSVWLA